MLDVTKCRNKLWGVPADGAIVSFSESVTVERIRLADEWNSDSDARTGANVAPIAWFAQRSSHSTADFEARSSGHSSGPP